MRLYHFTKSEHGLMAIRDRRLKVARLNELNDPFEFLSPRLERPLRRQLLKEKNNWHRTHGLICMSLTWRNPLMWGHYSESYKGICLGFDVADNDVFTKVRYAKDRPTLPGLSLATPRPLTEDDMETILYTKFCDWAYEEEYRAFIALEEEDTVSGFYFHPFSAEMKLVEVVVGARSTLRPERLATVLGDQRDKVSSFRARPGFTKFEVVRNKLKTAWRE